MPTYVCDRESVVGLSCDQTLLRFLIVVTLLSSLCDSLIPRECAKNATLPNAVCCPTPRGFKQPCGGAGRGFCRRVVPYKEVLMEDRHEDVRHWDDRANWPLRFFSFLCECQGAFFGVGCQECWFGRSGPDCSEKAPPLIRRDVQRMTASERLLFRAVLSISRQILSPFVVPEEPKGSYRDPIAQPISFRNVTVYDYFVFVHYFASRRTQVNLTCRRLFDFNHEGPGFPTWHRYFILLWERALGVIARDYLGMQQFALPFWDWTDKKQCDVCTDELIGDLFSPQSKSFIRRWPVYCPEKEDSACFGCTDGRSSPPLRRNTTSIRLPTTTDVLRTLKRRVYVTLNEIMPLSSDVNCVSFTRYFEGDCADFPIRHGNFTMHNSVHRSIRGPFMSTRTSPNDPLFLLHHTQMDRVLQAWYERRKPSVLDIPNLMSAAGHCRDCYLVGFLPLVTHAQLFTDSAAHGIEYESMLFGRTNVSSSKLTSV